MIVVGFDPSLSATGWAVLNSEAPRHAPHREDGQLVVAGIIKPDGDTKDYAARLGSLFREARAILDEYLPSLVVVELPASHGHHRGSKSGTYHVGQPIYGSAVGAVIVTALLDARMDTLERITPPRVMAFAADVWTRSLPDGARRTKDDPKKTRRVEYAATVYSRSPESFGPMTVAGEVADAVLLARYGLLRLKLEEQERQWRAGA